MADRPTVTIDGTDYPLDKLSVDAKKQLESLNLVDRKIFDFQQEIAIMQTARIAYSRALIEALPKS
jgi:BMFP domain-containing protein YqiC